jgi:hypothetical protein
MGRIANGTFNLRVTCCALKATKMRTRNRAKFKFGKLGVGKADVREVSKEWGSK